MPARTNLHPTPLACTVTTTKIARFFSFFFATRTEVPHGISCTFCVLVYSGVSLSLYGLRFPFDAACMHDTVVCTRVYMVDASSDAENPNFHDIKKKKAARRGPIASHDRRSPVVPPVRTRASSTPVDCIV